MRPVILVVVLVAACEHHPPSEPATKHEAAFVPAPPPPPPGPTLPPPPGIATHASYCTGTAPWPATSKTCTGDGDCGAAQRCWPDDRPDYSGMCGAYQPPRIDCQSDRDCKANRVCLDAGRGPCDGTNRMCFPRCTPTSCAAGEQCRKDGHCEPIPCKAGFACIAGTRCTGSERGDSHGCEVIPCWDGGGACGQNARCVTNHGCEALQCTTTAQCDCGACFDGYCKPRPGVCGSAERPQPPG